VALIGEDLWCGNETGRALVILAALCRHAVLQDTLFVDCSVSKTLYVRAVTNLFWFGKTAEIPHSHPQPSLNKGHICSTFVFIYFIAHRMQRGDDKDVSAMIKCRFI
jgi:hypothetical protein